MFRSRVPIKRSICHRILKSLNPSIQRTARCHAAASSYPIGSCKTSRIPSRPMKGKKERGSNQSLHVTKKITRIILLALATATTTTVEIMPRSLLRLPVLSFPAFSLLRLRNCPRSLLLPPLLQSLISIPPSSSLLLLLLLLLLPLILLLLLRLLKKSSPHKCSNHYATKALKSQRINR